MTFYARMRDWYGRFERPISSLSLIGGFVFDALTLHRVDLLWENIWVVGHLMIVTICALLINTIKHTAGDEADPHKLQFWFVNVMQFFFGGILSTYLVFYFRSGTLGTSWPFLLMLTAAFIANERLKRRFARLTFQIALLFLAYYAFAIYLLPIVFHQINVFIFLLSGIVSLIVIGLFIFIIAAFSREKFHGRNGYIAALTIIVITAAMNGLYFAKLIPPLPLSLKAAGAYASLTVRAPGQYSVQYEQTALGFLSIRPTVHITPGAPIYAYTAIFSPTAWSATVIHEWQHKDELHGWLTTDRVSLPITGGADGGWRTYSMKSSLTPGEWRVNVKTPGEAIIGRLSFNVEITNTPPSLTIIDL